MMPAYPRKRMAVLLPLLALLLTLLPAQRPALAAAPTAVTIAGSLQDQLQSPNIPCADPWKPDCDKTHLAQPRLPADDIWRGSFNIAQGSWEYKAALNNSWDENYGKNAVPGGPNIPLTLPTTQTVKFYYDHTTHWITDNINSTIATAAGSFQSELGCPADWSPDCLRSWLQDIDGDGIYEFETSALPPGDYEVKAAISESWSENYGLGGVRDGDEIPFTVNRADQPVYFRYDSVSHILTVSVTGAPKGNLGRARAHWLTRDTIAWDVTAVPTYTYKLLASFSGGMQLTPAGIVGTDVQTITLTPAAGGLAQPLRDKHPHLKSYSAFTIAQPDLYGAEVLFLPSQIAIEAFDAEGNLVDATGLQIPGVLDDLFAYSGPLGLTYAGDVPTLRLWAPTASSVRLHLFDSPTTAVSTTVNLNRSADKGVWVVQGDAGWTGKYYLYEVTVFTRATGGAGSVVTNLVTDPYAVSLSQNSTRSQIVNLDDPALKPAGWDSAPKPLVAAPEDIVLYELHVRDFSIHDATVEPTLRGTFKAFTETGSDGMKHLRSLAQAGLTHIHLLPAFDCASIDENKANWQQADEWVLSTYPPTSTLQQNAVKLTRDQDGFNWCYDPFHYTVPEGSYATETNGPARILEFRQMVQALNQAGLRVVMDVVYNHTAQSGQDPKSVLDKIVPGYYHRLNADGKVETSTCCQNTASEHAMMEKLMIDSLVTWASAYKIDGFRFDLMGHHMLSNMERARDALRALTPAQHGVDGRQIYLYGEGWNFGEVAGNARGVNATQLNLAGSGIGSFNDRVRDAARGGSPFDNSQDMKKQGFATGLLVDPNGLEQGTPEQQKARLLLHQDQIRVALAGNLKGYQFTDRTGVLTDGAHVDYNGSPAGYTSDPQEVINYTEAHDNLTLFDAVQLKAPATATITDRARMDHLGLDLVALGQGVPFFHAGQELLRSKSFDGNSYNSGDWFNRLDWSYQTNNFGVGLPPDQDSNWDVFTPLLANPALKPGPGLIAASKVHFEEMLRIRKSSPLFRLRTAAEIQSQVSFLNTGPAQTPGLIVMALSESQAVHLSNPYRRIVVIFNANPTAQTFSAEAFKGGGMRLHPVQAGSADALVRTASFDSGSGSFTVPPRTTAVFVQAERQLALPIIVRR